MKLFLMDCYPTLLKPMHCNNLKYFLLQIHHYSPPPIQLLLFPLTERQQLDGLAYLPPGLPSQYHLTQPAAQAASLFSVAPGFYEGKRNITP